MRLLHRALALIRKWHAATKLLACKVKHGTRFYRVQWADPLAPPSWEEADNVTDALKHDFTLLTDWQVQKVSASEHERTSREDRFTLSSTGVDPASPHIFLSLLAN